MIGIYKITSPTKKVYIGQSTNIEKRFSFYKRLSCKEQIRLYNSFLKYGIDKHKFEILCECDILELNEKERYYQDVFSATGKNGLNCILTKASDRSGKSSEETRKKIRDFQYNLPEHMKIARELKKIKTQQKRKNKQKKMQSDYVHHITKIILNTETGIFYFGNKEAAKSLGIKEASLRSKLSGWTKNKTPFIYC